jgi:hypothetical protein
MPVLRLKQALILLLFFSFAIELTQNSTNFVRSYVRTSIFKKQVEKTSFLDAHSQRSSSAHQESRSVDDCLDTGMSLDLLKDMISLACSATPAAAIYFDIKLAPIEKISSAILLAPGFFSLFIFRPPRLIG